MCVVDQKLWSSGAGTLWRWLPETPKYDRNTVTSDTRDPKLHTKPVWSLNEY
jgi:hypothetical protein